MDAYNKPIEGVEKYPFYPKPAPGAHDWVKFAQKYDMAVEVDIVNGQQIIVVSKQQP